MYICIYYCTGESGTIIPFVPLATLHPQHTQLTDSLQMLVTILSTSVNIGTLSVTTCRFVNLVD